MNIDRAIRLNQLCDMICEIHIDRVLIIIVILNLLVSHIYCILLCCGHVALVCVVAARIFARKPVILLFQIANVFANTPKIL